MWMRAREANPMTDPLPIIVCLVIAVPSGAWLGFGLLLAFGVYADGPAMQMPLEGC